MLTAQLCREDTPSRPVHHRRRPSGSNLKLQSSLKPLTRARETDSPSCGTPPSNLKQGRQAALQSDVQSIRQLCDVANTLLLQLLW